jgi:hypothetical protein
MQHVCWQLPSWFSQSCHIPNSHYPSRHYQRLVQRFMALQLEECGALPYGEGCLGPVAWEATRSAIEARSWRPATRPGVRTGNRGRLHPRGLPEAGGPMQRSAISRARINQMHVRVPTYAIPPLPAPSLQHTHRLCPARPPLSPSRSRHLGCSATRQLLQSASLLRQTRTSVFTPHSCGSSALLPDTQLTQGRVKTHGGAAQEGAGLGRGRSRGDAEPPFPL